MKRFFGTAAPVAMAAVAAATGAANGAATGATGADAGFTITYYGALTPGVATG